MSFSALYSGRLSANPGVSINRVLMFLIVTSAEEHMKVSEIIDFPTPKMPG